MPNPVQSAVRAVAEGAVELIAAWNRRRLPKTDSPTFSASTSPCDRN